MSISMYMYAEKYIDNKWTLYGSLEQNAEYYVDGIDVKPKEVFWEDYSNRPLYAILANIGNEHEVNEGEEKPFNFISKPRGLPNDVCDVIKAWAREIEEEFNQPSWLFLHEILSFEWNQKIVRRKMVEKKYAYLFENENEPFPFDRWPDNRISYADYMKDGLEVAWTEAYSGSVGTPFMKFINNISKSENPESIRFVFWFC